MKNTFYWVVGLISAFGIAYQIPWANFFTNADTAFVTALILGFLGVTVAIWTKPGLNYLLSSPTGDSRSAFAILVIAVFTLMGAAAFIGLVSNWTDGTYNLGTLGDFLGGTLNPILTFLTFVGLLFTIVLQQRELHLANEAKMKADGELIEEKKERARQQFENTFFQMLTLHNTIVNSLDLRSVLVSDGSKGTREWHGRDCFPRYYEHFKSAYKSAKRKGSANPVADGYDEFWRADQKDLAHYFRFLYNIVRVVDDSGVANPVHIKLLRAQLSDFELLVLFYNGIGGRGRAFRKYIEKYALFDNLPEELLLEPIHQDYYSADAYFDKHIKREDPAKFLDSWRKSYIYDEGKHPDEFKDVLEDLLFDAKSSGVTRWKLIEASGGDLEAYLFAALRKASGEDWIAVT